MEYKEKISRCNRTVKQLLRVASVLEISSYDMSFDTEYQDQIFEAAKEVKMIADKIHGLVSDYERTRDMEKNRLVRP